MNSQESSTQLRGLILEELTELTLHELCRACAVQDERIVELVEEGVITPAGNVPEHWRFTGTHLSHARVALRLQRDLGVNLAGAALALQLLEQIDSLQTQLNARDDATT
jgi:chaperone modulatory protein CbpM